jgi:HIRAN domain
MSASTQDVTDKASNPFALEPKYELVSLDLDADDGPEGEPRRDAGMLSGRGFVVERIADHQRLSWYTLPKLDGLDAVRVAGVSHRHAQLQDPSFAPGQPLALVPEPTNPVDPNAIAVWNSDRTLQIGYLPRAKAAKLAKERASNTPLGCLSMWEDRVCGQRVGLRILLVRERARVREYAWSAFDSLARFSPKV